MATALRHGAVLLALGALGGCELFANIPSYSASDGDGGGVGDGGGGDDGDGDGDGDGMGPECMLSTECAAPELCIGGTCRLCDEDVHCGPADANVCLPDGTCADVARIAYAAPAGGGTACSLAAPCTIEQAFTNAAGSATIDIVKLAVGDYPRSAQIQVGGDTVILAGQGATLTATATVAMLTLNVGSLTIVGATLVGVDQFNVLCFGGATPGTLKLHRVVSRAGAYGVGSLSCNLSITRSFVYGNTNIGAYVQGSSSVRIASSVVAGNGIGDGAEGGIQLINAPDVRIETSTIAGNASASDMYAGGITCSGSTSVVSTSISWGNVGTAKGPLDAACNVDYSVVEPAYGAGAHNVRMDPLFQALGNFHLQATSPARGAGDPALTVGVDFDNEVRPQGGGAFDCGADEIP